MIRLICLAALCFTLSTLPTLGADAPADEIEKVLVRTNVVDDYALQLRLANLQQEVTRVEIKHMTRKIAYFTDVIRNHNGYAAQIDLSDLPQGRYLLEISQQNESRKVVLRVNEHGLFVSDTK